ncbi:MAG: laccase domain-containing protein, partial [Hyphomicrobium sp.]
MLTPLTASNLVEPNIRHGFFTRQGGVSEGIYAGLNCGLGSNDDPANVLENRRRIAAHLGAKDWGASHGSVVTLYQVHGATAFSVTGPQD